jgi:hypothetical protein
MSRAFLFAVAVSMLASTTVLARTQLALRYEAEVQAGQHDPMGTVWQTVTALKADGIGGLQVYLDPKKQHRLKLTVFKPHDLKGTYKVRTPLRSDAVTLGPEARSGTIILGPHPGCQEIESRCAPYTIEEIGLIEFRMDLEKAKRSAFGVLLIRPYDEVLEVASRTAITFQDKTIACGSTVDKGWWIFASSINSNADPIDTISLCVQEPDGDIECADDRENEISKKANERGWYEFINWNSTPTAARCFIKAE